MTNTAPGFAFTASQYHELANMVRHANAQAVMPGAEALVSILERTSQRALAGQLAKPVSAEPARIAARLANDFELDAGNVGSRQRHTDAITQAITEAEARGAKRNEEASVKQLVPMLRQLRGAVSDARVQYDTIIDVIDKGLAELERKQ